MTMYDGDISTMAGDVWSAGGYTEDYLTIRNRIYAENPIPSFEKSVFYPSTSRKAAQGLTGNYKVTMLDWEAPILGGIAGAKASIVMNTNLASDIKSTKTLTFSSKGLESASGSFEALGAKLSASFSLADYNFTYKQGRYLSSSLYVYTAFKQTLKNVVFTFWELGIGINVKYSKTRSVDAYFGVYAWDTFAKGAIAIAVLGSVEIAGMLATGGAVPAALQVAAQPLTQAKIYEFFETMGDKIAA